MDNVNSFENLNKVNMSSSFYEAKDKCVYILLSKTSTLPSDVIQMWTKEPYAHTSLAFDIELNEMYSFARKKLHNPFRCGFIEEDITSGVFGRDVDTVCRVCRLCVTETQYNKIRNIIEDFKKESSYYKYNYLGIVGVMCNKAVERKYNYFCSQFVYYVLENAGVEMFGKEPGLTRPEDFRQWDKLELIYEGKLIDYRKFLHNEYMKNKSHDEGYIEYKKTVGE